MKKFMIIVLIFFVALGALAWWFTSLPSGEQLNRADALYRFGHDAEKIVQDEVFDEANNVALDIWRPAGLAADAKAPVLIFYYGGSWHHGDKSEYGFIARSFAELGYIVVLPNYRLHPQVQWPSMVEDTAASLAWTHDNISTFGGDLDAIFVSGHSAGAYNAVMAVMDKQWLAKHGKTDQIIRAMAPLAGPFDFYPFDSDSSRNSFGNAEDPQTTQPVNFARGDAPPLLFLTGAADTLVEPRNSKELKRRIEQQGGIAAYKEYQGIDHYEIIMAGSALFGDKAPVVSDMHGYFEAISKQPRRSPEIVEATTPQ